MPIDRVSGTSGFNLPEKSESPGNRTPNSEAVRGETGGRVELSAEARLIARLAARADALPEIRKEKVEALARSIKQGTYRVDTREVSRAILEFDRAFPG